MQATISSREREEGDTGLRPTQSQQNQKSGEGGDNGCQRLHLFYFLFLILEWELRLFIIHVLGPPWLPMLQFLRMRLAVGRHNTTLLRKTTK